MERGSMSVLDASVVLKWFVNEADSGLALKLREEFYAYLRTTMGAMVLFGVPPEEYWAYTDDEKEFDKEPPAFCYAFAQNYQAIKYFRHDPPGTPANTLVEKVKGYLSSGHPAMFGFTV
jgi:C1A family cysteine protease